MSLHSRRTSELCVVVGTGGSTSPLCAGRALTPSDMRWRPDRSSAVAPLRCQDAGQHLAPAGLQHGLSSLVWQRALQWPPLYRHFTHMPAVSEGRFLSVVFAGSKGTCICICIHISKWTSKHCLAFTLFFNIYFCIWLRQIFFVVCGLLSSGGTGASLPPDMWNFRSWPGIKPVSPALEGRFLTTREVPSIQS